jgi:hypothetical protein
MGGISNRGMLLNENSGVTLGRLVGAWLFYGEGSSWHVHPHPDIEPEKCGPDAMLGRYPGFARVPHEDNFFMVSGRATYHWLKNGVLESYEVGPGDAINSLHLPGYILNRTPGVPWILNPGAPIWKPNVNLKMSDEQAEKYSIEHKDLKRPPKINWMDVKPESTEGGAEMYWLLTPKLSDNRITQMGVFHAKHFEDGDTWCYHPEDVGEGIPAEEKLAVIEGNGTLYYMQDGEVKELPLNPMDAVFTRHLPRRIVNTSFQPLRILVGTAPIVPPKKFTVNVTEQEAKSYSRQ